MAQIVVVALRSGKRPYQLVDPGEGDYRPSRKHHPKTFGRDVERISIRAYRGVGECQVPEGECRNSSDVQPNAEQTSADVALNERTHAEPDQKVQDERENRIGLIVQEDLVPLLRRESE